jgi:hypothetical protein
MKILNKRREKLRTEKEKLELLKGRLLRNSKKLCPKFGF